MKITPLKKHLEALGFEVSYCRKDPEMSDQESGEERYRVASIVKKRVYLLLEPTSPLRMAEWEMVAYDDHSADFVRNSGILDTGAGFTDWTPFPEEDFNALLKVWGFNT